MITWIKIKTSLRQLKNKYSNKQRWNLKNPNWNLNTDLIEEEIKKILYHNIIDIEETTQIFTDLITDRAKKTIGWTNQIKKPRVPWWNDKIKETVSNQNKALKNFKKKIKPPNILLNLKHSEQKASSL